MDGITHFSGIAIGEGADDTTEIKQRQKTIAITATPTGAEQDTGWDLPAHSVVLDVFVRVTAAEATGATKTLDVGTKAAEGGGDADGFLDGVSVAAAGVVQGSLVDGAVTLGALRKETITDSAPATHSGRKPYAVGAAARSVVYTAGSNDFAEFRGEIVILYLEA